MTTSATKAGIELEMGSSAAVPRASVDAERLAQVLGNLVTNAIRHTPSGGRITLAASGRAWWAGVSN